MTQWPIFGDWDAKRPALIGANLGGLALPKNNPVPRRKPQILTLQRDPRVFVRVALDLARRKLKPRRTEVLVGTT